MRCGGGEVRPGRREGPGWWRHTIGMHGARLKAWGPRARAERTLNMELMVVTLEVSKLSGWLKASVYCRVKGHAIHGGEVRAGRREGPGWWRHTRGMHGEKARLKACMYSLHGGQGHARRAHVEHPAHARDAGGVETQRLVEGQRGLPSRGEGMQFRGERCEPGGGRAWGVVAAHKRHARGKGPTKAWGARARAERTENIWLMSVTLEVSKLSGWLNAEADCQVEGRACCDVGGERCEPGGGRACGVVAARQKWHARGRPDSRLGGQKGMRRKRTSNMELMVVTLEVLKLSGWLKADAPCRVEGRACDSGGRGASR